MADFNRGGRVHMNTGTIGHVDHGKTTLTAAITKVAADLDPTNTAVDFSNIDKAPEERAWDYDQHITCGVSHTQASLCARGLSWAC